MDQTAAPPPYITDDLPGFGGELKRRASHFVVEEIPLYEPRGEGGHLYLRLERQGWNTRDLQKSLARVFGLNPGEVGYAGLKDKHALVTQTFSLPLTAPSESRVVRQVEESLPVRVLWARRHGNKLKPGHLLGNRFRILVSDPAPGALETARRTAEALARRGLPNFFGGQRFGAAGDNALQGRRALEGGGPRQKWLRRLVLSAYQSHLFNLWLGQRMARGCFDQLLEGDVAKKTDTGGIFTVEDPAAETPRLRAWEITYTGPMYGAKMRWAQGPAGQWERELLEAQEVDQAMLQRARLKGGRRPARLRLDDIGLERTDQGLIFSFALPKGAYATTVLREFMKNPEAPRSGEAS